MNTFKKYLHGSLVFVYFFTICIDAKIKLDAKIYVAGHKGLVGSAIVRELKKRNFTNIIVRTRQELDLRNQKEVDHFFKEEKPDYVFLAAAHVGGIQANWKYPASFIYDNLIIETNVIHAAYKHRTKKLLFLGSSCIYPRLCPQPIKEEYLLTGELEETNEPYAIAKIAGIKLCQAFNKQHGTNFISCMPTNLYGINDNFDLESSHVLPALLIKIFKAKKEQKKEICLWGTGKPYREFLYVDDLAEALLFLMETYNGSDIINIGTGQDVTIEQLAQLVKEIVGYEGTISFDHRKPDGTPRKLLDVSRLKTLGWQASTSLKEGIEKTLAWMKKESLL